MTKRWVVRVEVIAEYEVEVEAYDSAQARGEAERLLATEGADGFPRAWVSYNATNGHVQEVKR